MNKGTLIKIWESKIKNEGKEKVMPKIGAQLTLPGEEAMKLNVEYIILGCEEFVSEKEHFKGIRVVLDGGKNGIFAVPLWYGETVSRTSKLGSFIQALDDDTDVWLGKTIMFTGWNAKNRFIEVIPHVEGNIVKKNKSEGGKVK